MQELECYDTEQDLDVDGISTASVETQVNDELMNLPVETHDCKQVREIVHEILWQGVRRLIVFLSFRKWMVVMQERNLTWMIYLVTQTRCLRLR